MNCGIYIRKSRKSEEAYRLELQRKELPEEAKRNGWTHQIFDDGFKSGKKLTELIELNKLIDKIKKDEINIVLVIEFSRLSRDESLQDFTFFLDICKKHSVKIASPGNIRDPRNQTEWFHCIIEAGFSAIEMWQIRVRMAEGRKLAKDKGRYLGGICPYGYRNDKENKTIVTHSIEKEIVRRIFTDLALKYSPREIAKYHPELNLTDRQVRRILSKSLKYAGKTLDSKKSLIDASWEPIISMSEREEYLKSKKTRKTRPRSTQSKSLLTGLSIFRCGYCGSSIGTAGKNYINNIRRKYYYCSQHKQTVKKCDKSIAVDESFLDEYFVRAFQWLFLNYRDLIKKIVQDASQSVELDYSIYIAEKKELEKKIQRLIDAIENGGIDLAQINERIQQHKNRILELDILIDKTKKQSFTELENKIDDVRDDIKSFNKLNFIHQKHLIKDLAREIKLYNNKLIIFPIQTAEALPEFCAIIEFEKIGKCVHVNNKYKEFVKKYFDLKKRLKTDQEVSKFFNISLRTTRRWKKKMNSLCGWVGTSARVYTPEYDTGFDLPGSPIYRSEKARLERYKEIIELCKENINKEEIWPYS